MCSGAGSLPGALASAPNRKNRNGESVAVGHQISVRECCVHVCVPVSGGESVKSLFSYLRTRDCLKPQVVSGPRLPISACLRRQATDWLGWRRDISMGFVHFPQ